MAVIVAYSGKSSDLWEKWYRRPAVRPCHGNQALKIGLLRHLIKMAAINEDDL